MLRQDHQGFCQLDHSGALLEFDQATSKIEQLQVPFMRETDVVCPPCRGPSTSTW